MLLGGFCILFFVTRAYRDLKSQNILLDWSGRAKVADFGIARAKQHTFLTTKHVNAGTIAYMAPELFSATFVDESTQQHVSLPLTVALAPHVACLHVAQ